MDELDFNTLLGALGPVYYKKHWGYVAPMVFCYQICSGLLWEKIVLVIEKNFWNSRLKAENLQKMLYISPQQLNPAVKGQNNFWIRMFSFTNSYYQFGLTKLRFNGKYVNIMINRNNYPEQWYFVTKIVLAYCEKKCSIVREKNFWNSRLKAENLQNFWDH